MEAANLQTCTIPATDGPYVFLIVGRQRRGQDHHHRQAVPPIRPPRGLQVTVGAADTFRAAAVDQLRGLGGTNAGATLCRPRPGRRPRSSGLSTRFKALWPSNHDVVLVDTAGRLHNKKHLMDELSKIKRVMQKVAPGVPHEVLLVLDGSTGQNALEQAKQFTAATEVSGLGADQTGRHRARRCGHWHCGGIQAFPVRFIGVGEQPEDLQVFNAMEFVDSLLPEQFGEEKSEA